jgi:hypothetical protein
MQASSEPAQVWKQHSPRKNSLPAAPRAQPPKQLKPLNHAAACRLTKQIEDGEGELAGTLHARAGGQHKALDARALGRTHKVAHGHKVRLLRVVAALPTA